MKTFECKVRKTVVQHYEAYVTVTAESEDAAWEAAEDAALALDTEEWNGDECDGDDSEDVEVETIDEVVRCPDCGAPGERVGHQTCQYPQNHD